MERDVKTRLTTALILLVVFASGVMLGLAADNSLSAEAPSGSETVEPTEAPANESEASEPEASSDRRYIYQQVDPNEAQLSRIDSIVAEWRAERDVVEERYRTEWDQARRQLVLDTRNAIKAVLSPEQAAEYQRLLDEWEAQRAADSENEDDRN